MAEPREKFLIQFLSERTEEGGGLKYRWWRERGLQNRGHGDWGGRAGEGCRTEGRGREVEGCRTEGRGRAGEGFLQNRG